MKPLIFIAGGSQGLGKAMCEKYLSENWDVIELSRSGTSSHSINCDFANVSQSNETFRQLFNRYKTENRPEIQLIINTASLSPFGNIGDTDVEAISKHLNININSAMMLVHQFTHAFQTHQAKKTLGYISSGAARRPIEGMALYCASKAALEHFTLTFNQEQQRQDHPINAMVINPGVMDTGMQSDIRQQSEADFPLVNQWRDLHANNQLADAKTVAEICHQLMNNPLTETPYHVAQSYLK
ncbi:SDR family NAD(P)-dependent oxidoreductase [Marinicella rhabdoformis]|uniref:SDR family NAD(P)-dependent oxidoreductase n=1 Tax=Marinicella rhabdoformis TaxID=2580566 RepID=UPI0012AECAC8|nr:SDR family NAD(P)-dependent oxidoreductase [Marinicella rhabdoformis]